MRPNNVALRYLDGNQELGERAKFLVANLGLVADGLLALAKAVASRVVQDLAEIAPKGNVSLVTTSVFDLFAAVYFGQVCNFLNGDNPTSSLLADALVFQATGHGAMLAAKDFNPFETYDTRGLHKFLKYRQSLEQAHQTTAGSDSKLTAYEIASILTGGPDIAIVYPVQGMLLLAEHDARCVAREILYGEKADPEQRRKVEEFVAGMLAGSSESFKASKSSDE